MTSDVLRATDWILQHKGEYDIRVANFSLQTGLATSFRFDPLDRALERLWQSGVVVVAAAGNYGVDGAPSGVLFSPANDPFVITVGAVDVDGDSGTGTTQRPLVCIRLYGRRLREARARGSRSISE